MKAIKSLLPAVVTAAAAVAPPAANALDVYMKTSGPEITGESTETGYEDWINVLSWGWGLSNSLALSTTGSGADEVSLQGLTLTKQVEKSSTGFYGQLLGKKAFTDVKVFTVGEDINKTPHVFTEIVMKGVFVESTTLSAAESGFDLPETMTLVFECIHIKSVPLGSNGLPDKNATTDFKWNPTTKKNEC